MYYVLALDIGGTKIAVGLVLPTGKVLSRAKYPTEAKKGSARVKKNIIAAIDHHLTRTVRAIGISIAGRVDQKRGVYLGGPNLPLKNIFLKRDIKRKTKLPVEIDNDAHCFALAEARFGAGKKYDSVFGVTLGTGIGGGFVKDGQIMHGATNTATEIGHTTVDLYTEVQPLKIKKGQRLNLPICSCGKRGHLEAYAGGKSIERRYHALTGRTLDAYSIEARYRAGEPAAKKIITDAQMALAAGFENILVNWNPDCIVIGGGLARFKTLWQPAVLAARRTVPFSHLKKTPIIASKLGDDAGVIGASLLTK